jgi:hypothetical protein
VTTGRPAHRAGDADDAAPVPYPTRERLLRHPGGYLPSAASSRRAAAVGVSVGENDSIASSATVMSAARANVVIVRPIRGGGATSTMARGDATPAIGGIVTRPGPGFPPGVVDGARRC